MGNQPTSLSPSESNKKISEIKKKSSTLDLFTKRLSLNKFNKHKESKKSPYYYPVPPNAERPSPPSGPEVFQDQDQYFILRWDPPAYDGGCPIIGYVIQHLELGLPQLETQDQDDTEAWYSSEPGQITQTECILNNLVPGTTYQFRIVAENLLGYSQPSDISEPIVFNPHGELDDWFFAPSFTLPMEDNYTVMEHEMLTLSVELKGQPYPMVHWYDKNDQDLSKLNKKKFKMRSCGYTRTLVINSVELTDAGLIKCVGSNKEGFAECISTLTVEAPPRIKRVQSPEFLQNPYEINEKEEERLNYLAEDDYEDLIFQAGELVRLKFFYSGSPKPEVHLYHNGETLTDPRIITEFTEKVITVKVENIMRCDRGEWLIKLDNVLGEDCTSVLITITDHPSPPGGKPEILQLSDNTCILRWPEPLDDGGCPVHNYIVEYFRSEWGVWLKALTSKVTNAKIKDLIPGSKYRFRVKAENLYGVSDPSEESVEILITDLPSARGGNGVDGLMTTVEESIEEDENNTQTIKEEEERLEPPPIPVRRSNPNITINDTTTENKLYSRADLIKSAAEEKPPQNNLLLSTPSYDEEEDLSYEYDFEKLQKEYEEEMLNDDDDISDDLYDEDDFDKVAHIDNIEDDVEMEEKYLKLKREWEEEDRLRNCSSSQENREEPDEIIKEITPPPPVNLEVERIKREIEEREIQIQQQEEKQKQEEKVPKEEETENFMEKFEEKMIEKLPSFLKTFDQKLLQSRKPSEEPEEYFEEIPHRFIPRSIKSEEKSTPKNVMLTDRFTDYLTMKVISKDKRIGSSMRSLSTTSSQGSESKSQSRENIRRDYFEDWEEKNKIFYSNFNKEFDNNTKDDKEEVESVETSDEPNKTLKVSTNINKKEVLPESKPPAATTFVEEPPKNIPPEKEEESQIIIKKPPPPIYRYGILFPLFFIDFYLTLIIFLLLLFFSWNKNRS